MRTEFITPLIPYPTKISEFEVQAPLFIKLKDLFSKYKNVEVRGEVKGSKLDFRRGNPRMDLVVFKDQQAIIIIETKNNKPKKLNKKTRQFITYSAFKLPLLYCFNESEIQKTVDEIESIMENTFYKKCA